MREQHYLTESEVIYAANHSMSNKDAFTFLRINNRTWFKYAALYFEPETGLNYCEYLKIKRKLQEKKKKPYSITTQSKKSVREILNGEHPQYNKAKLAKRLITEGYFEDCCGNCGFNERHLLTKEVPLFLHCLDGNETNFLKDNLQFLCYNCVSLITDHKIKIT